MKPKGQILRLLSERSSSLRDNINHGKRIFRFELRNINTGMQQVVLVGGDFAFVEHPFTYCKDAAMAAEWIRSNPPADALLLIKGSRGIRMEKLLDSF